MSLLDEVLNQVPEEKKDGQEQETERKQDRNGMGFTYGVEFEGKYGDRRKKA